MKMKRLRISYGLLLFIPAIYLSGCARSEPAPPPNNVATETPAKAATTITESEVNAAQQAWCDGLVKIGKAYKDHGDYKAVADQFIDEDYDFKEGRVFFRPTLALAPQGFRTTKAGALAYFIGGDPSFPNDKGFALKPWVKCRYDNAVEGSNAIQIHGDVALAMGNVYLTGEDGQEIFVDKFFAFRKGSDGRLRLIAHKSAVPNLPAEK
jgi:hypothetical protein